MRTRARCTICGDFARGRGLCALHYMRWRRTGDPGPAVDRPLTTCSLCDERHYAKGLCYVHYTRQRLTGKTERTTRKGESFTDSGYRVIWVNAQRVLEHRHVMEQILGRPLLPTEIVHHINRDKLDNRPENLELMAWSEHSSHHHEHDGPRKPMVHNKRPCLVCGKTPTHSRSLCAGHYEQWRTRPHCFPAGITVPPSLR